MSVGTPSTGVEEANAAFAGFAEENALPEEVRRSVNVALDELLANALSHGWAGVGRGVVTVEGELTERRLTLTLTDDGPPFDPFSHAAPDTTLSVEERKVGGLGIHLVRQLMDEVSYERRRGYNVVVLVKHLADG